MATIIKRRERVGVTHLEHNFHFADSNSGYSFSVDAQGNLSNPNRDAIENYRRCKAGLEPVEDMGIQKYTTSHVEPAVLRCDCNRELSLWDAMTNTCDCGREFNSSGQLLAPREQWGEETGDY